MLVMTAPEPMTAISTPFIALPIAYGRRQQEKTILAADPSKLPNPIATSNIQQYATSHTASPAGDNAVTRTMASARHAARRRSKLCHAGHMSKLTKTTNVLLLRRQRVRSPAS